MSLSFDFLSSKFPKRYGLKTTQYLLGLVQALAVGDEFIETQVEAVRSNSIAVTATGVYLDRAAGRYGIVRGQGSGLLDPDFQQLIPVMGMSPKQISQILLEMIDIFYGPYSSHANTTCSAPEPYVFENGLDLKIRVDDTQIDVVFSTEDFADISAATADEVATAISQKTNGKLIGSVVTDSLSGTNFVNIRTSTIGSQGFVQVLGGSAQSILLYPEIRPVTEVESSWSVARFNGSDEMIYTITSGVIPNFNAAGLQSGDFVTIRPDSGFALDNTGTFLITFVGDGFFRCENADGVIQSLVKNNNLNDFSYFRPDLGNVFLSNNPAALVESVPGQLIVVIPVTAPLVKRTLRGSHHFHNGVTLAVDSTSSTLTLTSGNGFDSPSGAIRPMGSRLFSKGVINSITSDTITLFNAQNWPSQGAIWSANLRTYFYYQGVSGNTLQNVTPAPVSALIGIPVSYNNRYFYTGFFSSQAELDALELTQLITNFNGLLDALDNDTKVVDTNYSSTLNITVLTLAQFITNFNLLMVKLDNDAGLTDQDYESNYTLSGSTTVDGALQIFNEFLVELDNDAGQSSFTYETSFHVTSIAFAGGPTLTGVFPDPTNLVNQEIACAGAQIVPNFPGSYLYDPTASFTISSTFTNLAQDIEQDHVTTLLQLGNVSTWPTSGSFVIEYGTEQQEGPIKYFATIGSNGLLVDPSFVYQHNHLKGAGVRLVGTLGPYIPRQNGQDLPVYTTSTSPARDLLSAYLRAIVAAGVQLVFDIRIPDQKWAVLPNLYTTDPTNPNLD